MANYKLLIKPSAVRELEEQPKNGSQQGQKPSPLIPARPGEEKYRLRQGNYRIAYSIEDEIITVTVVKIGHRREVYRQ